MKKFKKRTIILYILVTILILNAVAQQIYIKKQIGKILEDFSNSVKETTDLITDTFCKPNFEKMKLATVQIGIGKVGGAGVIIKGDKDYLYVLTAQHLFRKKGKIKIRFYTKQRTILDVEDIDRKNVYKDKLVDLVLIKVPKPEGEFYSISLAEKEPKIGDKIYTIGHPVKTYYTINEGIVSNYTKKTWQMLKKEYMLISAPSFSGNSGGAVLNKYTEVIGIVVGIFYYDKGILFSEKEFLPHMTYSVRLRDIERFLNETENNN